MESVTTIGLDIAARPQPTAQWIPGHWAQQSGGTWVWIGGRWTS